MENDNGHALPHDLLGQKRLETRPHKEHWGLVQLIELSTDVQLEGWLQNDVFWECARNGVLPDRGRPAVRPGTRSLPLYLVTQLRDIGIDVAEASKLDIDEARARLEAFYRDQ